MLVNMASCSTLAMMATQGWTTPGQEDTRLVAGQAAHVALEWWLQGQETPACMLAFRQAYEQHSNQFVPSDSALHLSNLERIMAQYFDSHPLLEMDFEVVTTEREIEAQLLPEGFWNEPPVMLTDRADGLVCNKENGSLWAFEHKTTSARIDAGWTSQWSMNPQIMAHCFAWRSEGYDVKGVLMNAIGFGRYPLPQVEFKTNRRSGEEEEVLCKTHHVGKSLCWQAHIQGQLFPVVPDESVYENWLFEQKENARRYRALLTGSGEVAMEGLVNGHCRQCHLKEFCKSGRSNYGLLIKREAPAFVTRSGLYNLEEPNAD